MSKYYVTMKDGNRYWKLSGGYKTHQEALDNVNEAMALAIQNDRKTHFYGFGTSLIDSDEPGILNKAGLMQAPA